MILVYFVLGLVFACFAMLASHFPTIQYFSSAGSFAFEPHLGWVFWLLIALSAFCLVPLLEALLYQLHLRKMLPRFLDGLYDKRAIQETEGSFVWLRNAARSLGGKLTATGVAVFATVFILSHTGAVRETDVDSYLYEYISRTVGSHQPAGVEPIAVSLSLVLDERDEVRYLQNCLTVVQDLKSVGAKAVFLDFRDLVNRGLVRHEETCDWLRKIENTGIVVFGMPEWVGAFRAGDASGEVKMSRGSMTMPPYELRMDPYLFRIRPEGSQDSQGQFLDVTLELLRKCRTYPKTLEPKREGNEVIFGDYKIPVTLDGWMYSRQSGLAWVGGPSMSALWEGKDDTLKYRVWSNSKGAFQSVKLQDRKSKFEGKIVFLENPRVEPEHGIFLTRSYISALQAISEGSTVSRSYALHIWLTLLCILAAGFVALKLRPLPSMLVIFALGLFVLLACWFIYDRFNLLIDVFYPLVAALMSMFVFPAVTVAEKMEEGEEAA